MLRTTGDLPELQRAVRELHGVAEAMVRWPDPRGPAELRVVIGPDAEASDTTDEVIQVLERVGGVDLDTLAPTPRTAAERPVFAGLEVQRGELDTRVEVTLRYRGREVRGAAEGLATGDHTPRTAAAATLQALREVVRDDVRMHVEWMSRDGAGGSRDEVCSIAVTVLTLDGQDQHIGSALIRGDLRESAVRATLDAVNRRLGRLIGDAALDEEIARRGLPKG
ncbi:hypothetical protein ER308_04765 [Egibacter rhizosphaerae]|uniref:2-isopropylmalate synthase LeuA allosteric (dimerisation) domain-containing protein n=1 Tax=Egibacter rhizosphaerae TaxID=1670831 RepID=A0A411YCN2_9ACTN|nr:hypothetical protein [Egibacter rhizosphaerae]QBI18922.1 hypothetical protein ER308_04765 [Egibacter rhizosphaerae]